MRQLLQSVAARAAQYLDGIQERRVSPSPEAIRGLDAFLEPLPGGPSAPCDVVAMLDEFGSPATVAMAGPRFFGFVIGGSLPAALAANWLAGAWDQNAGFNSVTPGVARLEQSALRRLIALFELPPQTAAGFVTGATVANFTALAAARHAVLARLRR